MTRPLRTVAGLLLARQLPEEYRYRDNPRDGELGDLESYLHGFGHMLDRTRATLEQLYADGFAEPVAFNGSVADPHGGRPTFETRDREVQGWLLPYLADLLGADLLGPSDAARRRELNNAVAWSKGRGTLRVIDSLADALAQASSVAVEGWRRTLVTPNLTLPPFTRPLPADARGRLPRGTPHFGRPMRAIVSDVPRDPNARAQVPVRDGDGVSATRAVSWDVAHPEGLPCFPGSHEDLAVRTPDVRPPEARRGHAHPARVAVHVRPLYGLFEPGLKRVDAGRLNAPVFRADPEGREAVYAPADLLPAGAAVPDKLVIEGDLSVPAGGPITLKGLLFTGTLTIAAGAQARLERCAVRRLAIAAQADLHSAAVAARDSLFETVEGPQAFARLVYVTVLGDLALGRLNASDSLFMGQLPALSCAGESGSCVRYSRLPASTDTSGCGHLLDPPNTTAAPVFQRFYGARQDGCPLRVPAFAQPGCGVLDPRTPLAVRAGAEDSGELGAHHHAHHMTRLRQLARKLDGHVPAGIDPVAAIDVRQTRFPPAPR